MEDPAPLAPRPPRLLVGLALVLVGWLAGCEEPVELDVAIDKPQLVLSAALYPDQRVYVTLTGSQPTTAGGDFPRITNAAVHLYRNNVHVSELTFMPTTGRYETEYYVPEVGVDYTLYITAPGYDPVNASTRIPPPIPLTLLSVEGLSIRDDGPDRIYDYHLSVDFEDPTAETNYYDLRIQQRVTPFIVVRGDTILKPNQTYDKGVSLATAGTGAPAGVASLLFVDKPPGESLSIHLRSRAELGTERIGEVVAELRTVSPEYYLFRRSLGPQPRVTIAPIEEPVVLFSSVRGNGAGVFAGYNRSIRSLPLLGR